MASIIAARLNTPLNDELPPASAWNTATAISFCSDWRATNEDPQRATQVRILWSYDALFIQFQCSYRELNVYEDQNVRKDQLWTRDVAEIFLQPNPKELRHYQEFEISPNGDWLDLDIAPGRKTHLFWNIKSRVTIDSAARIWTADMAIPMKKLFPDFNSKNAWHLNLFRIEGPEPNRFYSAWQPTHTETPNFHVPECFGELVFARE